MSGWLVTTPIHHNQGLDTPNNRIFKESIGFGVAEFVSMGVSLGVVGVADSVAPEMMKDASKFIGRNVIEPHLETIEKLIGRVCKLEECQVDTTKSREQRSEALGRMTILFGASWVGAMLAKLATRRFVNRKLGVIEEDLGFKLSKHEKIIFAMDEGIHYGSLLLLNTGAAKHTDSAIRSTASVLQKCGIPEHKAKELATMALVWELPNLLGLGAGIAGIVGNHKGWWGKSASHAERLAAAPAGTGPHTP